MRGTARSAAVCLAVRRCVLAVMLVSPSLSAVGHAAVTVTAARTETLYAPPQQADCTMLSMLDDAHLPLYAVRLRATAEGAPPDQVRFEWSQPRPGFGALVADLDLGPADQTAAVQAMCAEFGNKCILTPDQLPLYNKDTVLWVAPTCAILPGQTSRAFNGGVVSVGVKASAGRSKLGKATIQIGWGRLASITLFANGSDGIGVPAVNTPLNVLFGASVAPGASIALPPVGDFKFDNGDSDTAIINSPATCPAGPFQACATLFYHAAGTFAATVSADLQDKSVLCDNVNDHVGSVVNLGKLVVTTSPHRGAYASGDSVNLRVAFRNVSPNPDGSRRDAILLQGSGILSCASEVKVAGTMTGKTTSFDTQHCSQTAEQPCQTDGECTRPFCDRCVENESCVTQSHCSSTHTRPCSRDSDCDKTVCPACDSSESCVQVLSTPSIAVPIGRSVDLINKAVSLSNAIPATARVTDTWTIHPFNAPLPDAVDLKYRIRNKPRP